MGLSSVSLLYWTSDSNIRVVHRVKKRVIRATPGQIGEDCNEGEESKSGQKENYHPSKCTSSLLGGRLHHSFPPPEEPISGCSPFVFLLPAIRVSCDQWRACQVTHLTTSSPVGCVKVDHSLLFSISLCHLLRFPRRSWNFRCRSNARLR